MSTPPGAWNASKMVTWWPDLTSSPAAVSPARPPAHDGHAPPAGRVHRVRQLVGMLHGPVGHVTLEGADGDGLALDAAQALALALRLLGADTAGDAGQRVVVEQGFRGAAEIPFRDQVDEARDVHPHRAPVDAHRVLALQAAFRLRRGQQVRVAEVDLLEVRRAHIRHPFGHGVAVDGHALTRLELRSLAHREASAGAPAARVFSMQGPRLARASCSKLRYVARRSASIPKSTLCPSNSGPST